MGKEEEEEVDEEEHMQLCIYSITAYSAGYLIINKKKYRKMT